MLRVFCLVWCMGYFVDAAISILPSECPSNICVCNSDVNITCTSFPYTTRAAWDVDGANVFECVFGICASYSTDYGFYHDTTTGTFTISINPITIHHHQTEFQCYGEGTETIMFKPDVVARLKPPDFNISTVVETDKTHITVLTNCIDDPVNDVSFKLHDNTSATVKTENVISITSVACSNDDNPDCGGNNTARARATFTISTQATGTQTGIKLISTQNGVGVDDVFIGNYILKAEDLDSSEDSSSWCKNNLNECVSMSVVVSGVALSIIIAIIVAVAKGQTNQARARQPEVVSGADKDSEVEKHNDPILLMVVKDFPTSVTNETIESAFEEIGVKLKNIQNAQGTMGLNKKLNCTTVDRIVTVTVESMNEHQSEFVDIGPFKLKKFKPGQKPYEYSFVIKEISVKVKDVPKSVTNATIESAFNKMKQKCIDVLDATNTASYNRRSSSETIDRTVTIKEPEESLPVVMPIDRFKFILHCVPSNKHFKFIYSLTEMTLLFKGVPAETFSIETMVTMLKQICLQVVYINIDMNGKRHDHGLKCLTYDLDVTVSEKDKGSSVCLVDHLPSNITFSSYDFQQEQEHTVYLNRKSDRFKKKGHSMSTDNTKTSRAIKEIKMTIEKVPVTVKNKRIKSAFVTMKHKGIACSASRLDRIVTVKEPEEPLPAFITIDDRFYLEMQHDGEIKSSEFIYSCTEMDTFTFTGVPLSLNINTFVSDIEAELDELNNQKLIKVTIDYVKHDYGAVDLTVTVSDKSYVTNLKLEIEADGLIFKRQTTGEHTTYKYVKSANKLSEIKTDKQRPTTTICSTCKVIPHDTMTNESETTSM